MKISLCGMLSGVLWWFLHFFHACSVVCTWGGVRSWSPSVMGFIKRLIALEAVRRWLI